MRGISGRDWVLLSQFIKPNEELLSKFGEVKAQIISNRNLDENLLESKLKDLIPPSNLPAMDEAVERIKDSVLKGKRIVLFGDYDVDGITGTAILYDFLKSAGARVVPLLPSRRRGYGLTKELARKLSRYADLLITVDNGTNATEELRELDLPVIILDHHNPRGELPKATMVNPKLSGEVPREFREISSSGLAFYMSALLRRELQLDKDVREYLWLACMGTVADVMPLNRLNRIIVSKGIQLLNYILKGGGKAEGIRALMERIGIRNSVSSKDIAFSIAPRLNAPGRVSKPYLSLKLLLTEDAVKARLFVEAVDRLNELRKRLTQQALEEAMHQATSQTDKNLILVTLDQWAGGVAGIVAGRLASQFSRPAIVFSIAKEYSTASVRGLEGMDVYTPLESISHLFLKWGGHSSAVGLTIRTEDLPIFQRLVRDAFSHVERLQPSVYVDMELPTTKINDRLIEDLRSLEPYGEGFPEPVFLSEPLRLEPVYVNRDRVILKAGKHRLVSWNESLNSVLPSLKGLVRKLLYQVDGRNRDLILVDAEA
ncbi:MAG: single-stranded-DNA-specific exonuclease RecJ [Acidobacteria bacterium]|nr:MAG: single-stranded-DNA-specific exonuclease RecJ [Acidobacteriota bacterium]